MIFGFNTQPPEGGWEEWVKLDFMFTVSTHSRPKAAGRSRCGCVASCCCFNTQPPEGGWGRELKSEHAYDEFQHTAARRRLAIVGTAPVGAVNVSTHSRPKAAGDNFSHEVIMPCQFQHTAARRRLDGLTQQAVADITGFNTQPPEGGWWALIWSARWTKCFNTQPPEGGWPHWALTVRTSSRSQHTAARRRLAVPSHSNQPSGTVSTHSRPKAAGSAVRLF